MNAIKYYGLLIAGLSLFIVTGCSTNPLTLPKDEVTEVYQFPKNELAKLRPLFKQQKKTIAVFVDSKALADSGIANDEMRAMVENSFLPDMQATLSQVSFLRTTTANPDLMAFAKGDLSSDSIMEGDVPDYMLLSRIVHVGSKEDTLVRNTSAISSLVLGAVGIGLGTQGKSGSSKIGAIAAGAGAVGAGAAAVAAVPQMVDVKVYFELFDRAENRMKCCKTLHRQKGGVGKGGESAAILELLEDCAEEYLNIAIADMGPLGLVSETRGNGEFAYVTLGTDMGLNPNDKVSFLKLGERVTLDSLLGGDDEDEAEAKDEDEEAEAKDEEKAEDEDPDDEEYIPFETIAVGTVIDNSDVPPENKKAWIQVEDYEKAKILKGHAVRIRPTPVKRKDSLLNRFGF